MTLNQFYSKYRIDIVKAIETALTEDKFKNDITSNIILKGNNRKIKAVLLCKEDCLAAGIDIFKLVYKKIDPGVKFENFFKDGDFIRNKQTVLTVKSSLKNLLRGERTALNFIQRMSGIATMTNNFVKKLKFKGSKILHTRKTTPNFRLFELAAVKIGGGDFHRFDLGSAVLIKDNHIISAGSVGNVLKILQRKKGLNGNIEVEIKSYSELGELIRYGKGVVKKVMLDNYKEAGLDKAIKKLKEKGFELELSGGIDNSNFMKKQRKGIDYYSIGMLTHSYKSVDFSLEFPKESIFK